MGLILFFDTETTGLPDWKKPSGSENQPHLVELAAILADEETEEVKTTIDVIVKPENWVISTEVSDIHGITHEKALKVGVNESHIVNDFFTLWKASGKTKRVCHNRTFDQRIMRIAAKRYLSDKDVETWADKENFECTMLQSKPIMKMLPKGRFGYKNPRLSEAYEFFTGKKLVNAHRAMADTKACMEIYFAMKKFGEKS